MAGRPLVKSVKCTARSARTKKPCQKYAILGATVCRNHGGASPQVKRKAAERVRDILADLIDPDKVLREAGWIARFDARTLFDAEGNLLPPKQWPDEVAASIASIEVVKKNILAGDGKVDDVIKLRVADKLKALEMLFKHLGLLKERVEHSGGIEVRWQE